jgi:hypothetical protein
MANAMRATRPSRFWQQIGRLSSRPRLYSTSTQFDYDLIILGMCFFSWCFFSWSGQCCFSPCRISGLVRHEEDHT